MDGGFTGADEPDPDDRNARDSEFDGIRGWLPPDDRLWRHPSEMGAPVPPKREVSVDHSRSSRWFTSAAVVCMAGVLIGGVVMATIGASPLGNAWSGNHGAVTTAAVKAVSPTTEPGVIGAATSHALAQTVSAVRPSIVALAITTKHGRTVRSTGVTVERGGIIVTPASAVAGATSISTVDADGQRNSASLVAVDLGSNLAIVHVQRNLPVAPFSKDDNDMNAGAAVVAVALKPDPDHSGEVTDAVYAGTVASSGTTVDADITTEAMSATTLEAPMSTSDVGGALIDHAGDVAGIMDTATTMNGHRVSVFLPAGLVVGVAKQLLANGSVQHGWLGIDASDVQTSASTSGGGARVDSVQAGGAAAQSGIEVGDSIIDINSQPIRSLADLRTRLYAEPPGSIVAVTYDRNGTDVTVDAQLTGIPVSASQPIP